MLTWIKIIVFIIGNAPSVIRLIRELRGLMKDMPAKEKEALMRASKDDLESYKQHKDMDILLNAVRARKEERRARRRGQ